MEDPPVGDGTAAGVSPRIMDDSSTADKAAEPAASVSADVTWFWADKGEFKQKRPIKKNIPAKKTPI